jgi:uncharacterized protein
MSADTLIRYVRMISILLILAVVGGRSYGASFDCQKDGLSKIENIICADSELSKLDSQLGSIYTLARATAGADAKDALLKAQKTWLATRKLCSSAQCLHAAYDARIAELSSDQAPSTAYIQSDCSEIASLSAKRLLSTVTVAPTEQHPPENLPFIPDKTNDGILPGTSGAFLDLAGDGEPVYVLIGVSKGTDQAQELYYYDKSWNYIPQIEDHYSDDVPDRALLRVNGHYYVLLMNEDEPRILVRFTRANPQAVACEFKSKIISALKTSRNDPLCKWALANTIPFVEFDGPALSDDDFSRERSLRFGSGSVRANIANDGVLRPVTPLEGFSYAGRGASVGGLAIWDPNAQHVDGKLSGLLGGPDYGRTDRVFVFRGHYYVNSEFERTWGTVRTIKQLVHQELTTVCEFEGYPAFEVR